MSRPDPHQIDLWCTFCDLVSDDATLGRYRRLLSEAERRQQERFHFARDRHRYLITRALVRTTLSRYVDLAPEAWTFAKGSHGRPEIANDDARIRGLCFNISHTDKLVVVGITHHRALGIDTENARDRRAALDIADRFFSRQEVADLRALPLERQQEAFFRYWTLKESYIKARELGLSIPLDLFSFHFPTRHRIEMTVDAKLNDDAANWQFWQAALNSDHLLAVCARRLPGASVLVLQQVIPLVSQSGMTCTDLSSSSPDPVVR